ncbi:MULTISPECIES: N-acetyltransferase family protein [unclassified Acinetobacter]|uniref:GNAT family N-acetyltransferase n=1 Tax=unclassified Acinetobacter TaxID=196816 RepID=UPI0029352E0E|nr:MULTISPECIES: N-acetyltransferase family protein [unclassified Acinetobacter]WOE30945.1 N-acetyltransferase family protein [Acinetobacter sp. SAAs470]WOE39141.1 N-acetyltransferase family protein [Acinetobacter sp. SAAs474]
MSFIIRSAELLDLPAIQAIYNPEVLEGLATWNEQPFELEHFKNVLIKLQQQNYPLLVIENTQTQEIAGYADYAPFRSFTGYRFTVEHSVYIAPKYSRQGLGRRLLEALIQHAQQNHVHVMIAAIDHENLASIHLHQKLGFQQTGYMPEVGYKFGSWRDLVLMQLNFKTSMTAADQK